MKRYTIKLGNNDSKIILPAIKIDNLLGYDDDVSALVNTETDKSINSEVDAEVRRIIPFTSKQIEFRFWNGSSYVSKVAPLEFTNSSDFNTAAAKNSFYIIQLFDTFRDEVQSKKHTGFYNGFDFAKTSLNSIYNFTSDIEFSNLYVSQSLLNSMNGQPTEFFIRFFFYCAKSGKIYTFYNDSVSSNAQDKLYHRIVISPTNLEYYFAPDVTLIRLNELLNPNYSTFINNTVESIPVEQPNFPAGNTFTNDGNYIEVN